MALRLLPLLALVAYTSASFCGDSAIPFSFEALPDGQPVLGCARPTCFGWGANGQAISNTASFYRINKRPDGYFRKDRDSIPPFHPRDKRYFMQHTAMCEPTFQSSTCEEDSQWVAGIAPLLNVSAYPTVLQCCSYEPLRHSTDRGIATVAPGQIVIGGEVAKDGVQYAFDYISDLTKHIGDDGSVYYDVSVRRFPCLPLPAENEAEEKLTQVDVLGKKMQPATNFKALEAPTYNAGSAVDLGQDTRIVEQEAPSVNVQGPYNEGVAVEETVVNKGVLLPSTDNEIKQIDAPVQLPEAAHGIPQSYAEAPLPLPAAPAYSAPAPAYSAPAPAYSAPAPAFSAPAAAGPSYAAAPAPSYSAPAPAPAYSAPSYPSFAPAAPSYPVASYGGAGAGGACAPTCAAPATGCCAPAAASSYYCFTADTMVRLIDGTEKRMDELQVKDWVQTLDATKVSYAPVNFWLHRVPSKMAAFKKIELSDGTILKLTAKHYIYKTECDAEGQLESYQRPSTEAVFADEVDVGDCLYRVEGTKTFMRKVAAISDVEERGYYSPMTANGKIVVNGVYASCHNIIQSHSLQNSFFSYVDYFNSLYETYFGFLNSEERELPMGMETLMQMVDFIVPKNLVTL